MDLPFEHMIARHILEVLMNSLAMLTLLHFNFDARVFCKHFL